MDKKISLIKQTTLDHTGLKSFRDAAALLLMSRKLLLKRTMHANMIYYAYLRFQNFRKLAPPTYPIKSTD